MKTCCRLRTVDSCHGDLYEHGFVHVVLGVAMVHVHDSNFLHSDLLEQIRSCFSGVQFVERATGISGSSPAPQKASSHFLLLNSINSKKKLNIIIMSIISM